MSVESILQSMAENAGRRELTRGALIGNTVAGAAQVPAQIIEDRTRDALLKRSQAIQDEQLGFQRSANTRAEADQAAQNAANALAVKKSAALKAGIAAGFGDNPDPKNFDEGKAIKAVTDAGFPDLTDAIVQTHKNLLPKLTSGAAGSVMRDESGQVVPGSEIPEKKPDYTINGQRFSGATNQPIGDQVAPLPTPAAAQTHNMRLKGFGDVPVDYVPNKDGSGGKWMYQGMDVTGKVAAIPSAAITIHNQNANAPVLPDWATNDSRPSGADANKLDSATRMTPNGLFQAAMTKIATGQYPQTGRGSDPASQATRAAVNAKVGAIAAASGMDEPALRAFYKANNASLTANVKMQDAVQGFMATADKNADLLQKTLDKIPDIGVPLFNKPLRLFATSVSGDPNMSQFATYLQSVQNEYGRIIAQPNLAGQLTDSARKEAEALLDPKATVPQIIASVQALKNEGDNRLISVGEQIQRIQKRMQGGPGAADTKPTAPAAKPTAAELIKKYGGD